MKNLNILLYAIVLISFAGCQDDFLDLTPQDKLNSEAVWNDPKLVELVINEMYQSLPDGFNRGWYMLGAATDDGENSYGWPSGQAFNRGDYGPSNYPMNGTWFNAFTMIRQANLFFANVTEESEIDADIRNRMTGEVHFLRGFYYFDLMRHYGGVPILEEALSLDDDFNIPRNSKEEVIAFVIKELDAAAGLLPESHDGSLLGKATRGAALALKGRTLLYAEKWAESAAASKQVIDAGTYTLFSDYHSLFHAANDNNEEVIFDKQFQDPDIGHWANLFNHPISFPAGGWGGTSPTQELVDAYEMTDGMSIEDSPLYDSNDPYTDRDPRFYASIFYDGSPWREQAVETRIGGLSGIEKNGDATKTGYYLKKFLDESFENYGWGQQEGSNNWIHIRYAEVLLNYAEAQNEASGPDASVYSAVNEVRARPGVNMPALPAGLSKDQMRARIRNERRIELAFEEHRFFDVRRWGIGEDVFNKPIHGIRIGPNGELTGADAQGKPYGVFEVENRVFAPKNNLAPIPQSEIDKLSDVLTQNPGY
ncbi:RagB/SusD family nutrient uptake outer membrane protein [Flagellimonas pacifica]|uniref:Starch-binding associating with outer membrane n=1 Tax=Flagellimonas pacifica TaxID=1247520 RepID=A0A285MQC6_9FLAO|nr:RagB/SusD family nutrient uptake outer membrane protein [Allomuricauda parva]SNY99370.1 Starch-binding associating with outer membrane [Allomuricauda parva]